MPNVTTYINTYRERVRRTWRERLFSWPWRPWRRFRVQVRKEELLVVTPTEDAVTGRVLPFDFPPPRRVPRPQPWPEPPTAPMYAPGTSNDEFADTVFMPSQPFVPAPLDWPVINADTLPRPIESGGTGGLNDCSSNAL